MNILLLGGTGVMGRFLAELLLKDTTNQVFVTTRRLLQDCKNKHYLTGDAHDLVFLNKVLQREWDVIVDFMSYHTAEFQTRADLLLRHTQQYIFLSSSRVYALSDQPLTESSPRLLDVSPDSAYLAKDEYALEKARQEDILRNNDHFNWTIIRPYITFGEQRLQLGVQEKEYWLYRALHGRTIVFSKDIASKRTTLTWGYDVARGIHALVGKSEALKETFHITQPKPYLWSEILETYLDTIEKECGSRPNVFWQDQSYRLRNRAERYQVLYDRLYDREFDTSKIGRFLDISTFADPIEKIVECLTAFLAHPVFLPFSSREEGYFDFLTHEKTPRNEFISSKRYLIYLLFRYMNPVVCFWK